MQLGDSKFILDALKDYYAGSQYISFPELRLGVGYSLNGKTGDEKRIDYFVMEIFKPFKNIAYEIKISRADFRADIRNLRSIKQSYALLYSNEFYYITYANIITANDLPYWAGLKYVQDDGNIITIIKAPHRDCIRPTWSLVASISRRFMNGDFNHAP